MGQHKKSAERPLGDAPKLKRGASAPFPDGQYRNAPEFREQIEGYSAASAGAEGSITASEVDVWHMHGVPAAARFKAGETIAGRFVVVRFIAQGGMGEVYEVEDRLLQGNRVALKTIRPEIAASAEASRRFEQEVLLARKVNHPNLCPIYEIFRCDESPPAFLFLTMKLLTGETLQSRLQSHLPLPTQEALEVFRQMVAAIAAIHAAGVIHRDIKPSNVMLDRSGSRMAVSLMDFGLARSSESHTVGLLSGMVAGTPGYLAPELMRGHPPSQAADVFALGVVLHQALTGERPCLSADGSVAPATSLARVAAPALYLEAVRDFLSQDPVVRCRAFDRVRSLIEERSTAHATLQTSPLNWSRRQMLVASGSLACGLAGGVVWKRDRISELLHPLPTKRFVALMGWPPSSDPTLRPMLSGLIDAVATELARAEVYDRNLFLIPHFSSNDAATAAQVDEIRESLGANLILAASGSRDAKDVHVALQVLQSPTSKALRAKHLHVPAGDQLGLPQKAIRAAAELLDIRRYEPNDKRAAAGTDNPEAYAAFQAAEALRKQDNDGGLQAAIAKYKEAIELDRRYAQAHAKLAVAYYRLSVLKRDPAALLLSRANSEAALALDPASTYAHMAHAVVLQQQGDDSSALREMKTALSLDPESTPTLVWQAQMYADLNRWQESEDCFRRALRLRPNYWSAHNDLGVLLDRQGKYSEALTEFRAAGLANPQNAMALSNMGAAYLQLGRVPESMERLKQSLKLLPSASAAVSMAQALRFQGDTVSSLQYAKKATELDPGDSSGWLELGDCHVTLGERAEARKAYEQGARIQRENLETYPTDGPGWMLLALFEAKTGATKEAAMHMARADSLPAADLDTQMIKARTLELTGKREEALKVLAMCFTKGMTGLQVLVVPEMAAALRSDPRYRRLLEDHGQAK